VRVHVRLLRQGAAGGGDALGQDGEDREDDHPDLTIQRGGHDELEVFAAEIHAALRYERGLVVKAIAVLAVLAVIVVLRTLYFA
jgi:hypothetical protein